MFLQNYMRLMQRMSKDVSETNWIKNQEEKSIKEALTNTDDHDIIFKQKLENAQKKLMLQDQAIESKRAMQLKK